MLLGGMLASGAAQAIPILTFGQSGTSPTVTGTANGGQTTIATTDTLIFITGLDSAVFTGSPIAAYLTFTSLSYDMAIKGTGDNVRQNYNGTFTITSGKSGAGTNYLSGSYKDLFEALNTSATLIASTPPASNVTFTSDVIAASELGVDRGVSLSFSGVSPGVLQPVNGTIPSFTAAVSGNFSAERVSVPEPMSIALLGSALLGTVVLTRRRA